MPTKKKTTKKSAYVLSRAKLEKRLNKLIEKCQEFDIYTSTYADIEQLVGDLESELSDLAYEVPQKTLDTDEDSWC